MAHRTRFEADDKHFSSDAYTVRGHGGIAFYVLGWEVEPDEDTEWSGYYARTGSVVAVMVGDDHRWIVDEDDLIAIDRDAYCGVCGQIGCQHDGLDRSESDDDEGGGECAVDCASRVAFGECTCGRMDRQVKP